MDIKDYIIKHTAGNLYWKDKNSIYLGCNENMAKIFKLKSTEEVIGKNDYDFYLEKEHVKKIIENDLSVINSGEEQIFQETGSNEKGQLATYLTKKIPLQDNSGNIIGLVGVSIDITDLKQAEEREKQALVEVAEAKAQAAAETELRQAVMVLAGSIAHDLRTPIAIVRASGVHIKKYLPVLVDAYRKASEAQLPLMPDELRPDHLHDLEENTTILQDTAIRMNDFINITLDTLSKVVRGDLTSEDLMPCSMNASLRATLGNYPFEEEEESDCVHWDREDFQFLGNEVLIIRVLSNLLKNSLQQIKKNQRGEIFITTEEGEKVNRLHFKDTAGGAPPEIVEQLFEGYYTNKEKGTGIGLAFCKLTLKSFGGDITCQSVYGDFIEFTLTFPKMVKMDR